MAKHDGENEVEDIYILFEGSSITNAFKVHPMFIEPCYGISSN